MKYLIVGLGNIGDEYAGTRHNIGFMMIDAFAASVKAEWQDKRYGFVAKCRVKNAEMVLLKPSTYMNLSGNAVRYWLGQEKIPVENMLVLAAVITGSETSSPSWAPRTTRAYGLASAMSSPAAPRSISCSVNGLTKRRKHWRSGSKLRPKLSPPSASPVLTER